MIHIGTSGWQYRDWKGRFYPEKLPQREWLPYFAERFPIVEINNTFYMLPKEETFVRWRETAPAGFTYVVKANRYITHLRRLREPRDSVKLFWSRARRLGKTLGPVLFQFPPNFQADIERLRGFLAVLPKSMRSAFEFRHASWETDEVYETLDDAGCALVLGDRPGLKAPDVVTGDWSYVRFHQGQKLGPWYPKAKLRKWADRIVAMPARETYVFFNNDPQGAAIRDAYTLADLLEERGAEVRGPRRVPEDAPAAP